MPPAFGGIDFGTSNSTVGIVAAGRPQLVALEGADTTLPSAVFFNFEDNHTYFGRRAIADYTDNAEGRLLRALKSVLGSSLIHEKTRIKARSVAFSDIIGEFIGFLKARLDDAVQDTVEDVVLGRPVHSSSTTMRPPTPQRRDELEKAARRQGFKHIEFQYEPIAAALDYEQSVQRQELALIVDIGGGTSDFSIVRVSPEGAKGGRPQGRHPRQCRRACRRHGFRQAAVDGQRHARTRLSDADARRKAQPAGRLLRRSRRRGSASTCSTRRRP